MSQIISHGGLNNERKRSIVSCLFAPTVSKQDDTNTTLVEISIVTESQRILLLDGVVFVNRASAEIQTKNPTLEQRLDYL